MSEFRYRCLTIVYQRALQCNHAKEPKRCRTTNLLRAKPYGLYVYSKNIR